MAKVRYLMTGTGRCPAISLSGEGTVAIDDPNGAVVKLVRSPDDGVTFEPVTAEDGGEYVYTAPITFELKNHGPMIYSLDCISFGSAPFYVTITGN